jgi:hypothetical protein
MAIVTLFLFIVVATAQNENQSTADYSVIPYVQYCIGGDTPL